MTRVISYIGAGFVAVIFVLLVFGSWVTIDQGDIGIKLRNGAFVTVLPAGLHYKFPIIDDIKEISIRTESMPHKMGAYSRDAQVADLTLNVIFRVDQSQAEFFYSNYQTLTGGIDRVLRTRAENAARVVFGKFNASTAIAERDVLITEVQKAVKDSMSGTGFIIDSVQVGIDFSHAFENSVEQRMLAEVEVTRLEQNLEREKVQADIVRTKANAERDKQIAVAEGVAEAIRLKGVAEATSIDARGKALKKNPDLVRLIQAEKWDGTLPTTMLPNSTVPFLEVK